MRFLFRLMINAASLWIAVELVPSAVFDGRFIDLLIVALVFGFVNAVIRPLAKLLTLPLNIATLGLFTLVVNGAMLLIVAQVTDSLGFDGGFVTQFGASILAALVVSVVSTVLSAVLPDGR